MPRTFVSARQAFRTISAQAPSCQPQQTHRPLLKKNTQKPAKRRAAARDPTSQAASSEAAMAGHCSNSMILDNIGVFAGFLARACHFPLTSAQYRLATGSQDQPDRLIQRRVCAWPAVRQQGRISIYGKFSINLAVNVKSHPYFSPAASGQAAKRLTAGLKAARERGALMAT